MIFDLILFLLLVGSLLASMVIMNQIEDYDEER